MIKEKTDFQGIFNKYNVLKRSELQKVDFINMIKDL